MSHLINNFGFLFAPGIVRYLVLIWCTGIATGFALLFAHGAKPNLQVPSANCWPCDVEIERLKDVSTLLFFVHPQCPCTFASLAELERVVAQPDISLQIIVILDCPTEKLDEWLQTAVAKRAKGISNARILVDSDGQLASKFRASVSGQCLLYSPNGKLVFQGGLTASRGHEGESFGQALLIQMLSLRAPTELESRQPQEVPVYGCELVLSHSSSIPPAPCCKGN